MSTSTSDMLLPILLVGLIALLFGALIGALIASAARSGSSKSARAPTRNLTQVLQVWRDRRSGRLVVGMDDETFPAASGLTSRQRISLQQMISELQGWLGVPQEKPAENPTALAALELKKPISAPPVEPAPLPIIAAARPSLNPMVEPLSQPPPSPPTGNKPEPPHSIVAQIDEILQEALPHTILKNRTIRLVDMPAGGMQVVVDGRSYDGVGEVPDPEVRLLIQKCVSRWEQKA